MKTRTKSIIAALTLFLMLPFTITPASAMTPLSSKQSYGDVSKGIINVTSGSPVVLESQTVTFDLEDYPKFEYENPEEFKEYSSTVTSEYRLYNPTDHAETLKIAFPMYMYPEYGECNVDLFEVTVNGLDAGGEVKEGSSWYEENSIEIPEEKHSAEPWYIYEITLGAGERVTTAVTSPVYPTVNQDYEPEIFEYYYIYSPYEQWAEYGYIDVKINTDYYLLRDFSYDYGFTEAEGGYLLHIDDLHTVWDEYTSTTETAVSFTLSSSENPEYVKETNPGAIIVAILLLIVIPIVLVIELVRTVVQLIGKGINYVIELFR